MTLIIESATENEQVKMKIFSQICSTLKPEAILSTNTSSISITRLASSTDRPEKFIGIHLYESSPFNGVGRVGSLVLATEEETFEVAREFVKTTMVKRLPFQKTFQHLWLIACFYR